MRLVGLRFIWSAPTRLLLKVIRTGLLSQKQTKSLVAMLPRMVMVG